VTAAGIAVGLGPAAPAHAAGTYLQWYIATATSYNQQLAEQIAIDNNGGGMAVRLGVPVVNLERT